MTSPFGALLGVCSFPQVFVNYFMFQVFSLFSLPSGLSIGMCHGHERGRWLRIGTREVQVESERPDDKRLMGSHDSLEIQQFKYNRLPCFSISDAA